MIPVVSVFANLFILFCFFPKNYLDFENEIRKVFLPLPQMPLYPVRLQ